jgi:SAM-dependent methyltransferase
MSACIICGDSRQAAVHRGSDRLYRTTDETFDIVRCGGCGLMRLDPVPSDLSRFYPSGYWHEPGRLAEMYRKLVIRDHVRFVRRALRMAPGRGYEQRVLDVGCGSGLFLGALTGVKGIGMDVSARAAAAAWRRYGVPAIVGDLNAAPFGEASFDLISMFHVLEHLPDPGAYLRAARRLLAPGGRLVVQTPHLDCWQYRAFGARWIGLDIPRHLFDFRLEDLRRLLEMSGFRVARIKHFSLRDNPACLATTLAPGLEPVARANRGEHPGGALYLALTVASLPFSLVEALFGHGATIMIEAALNEGAK